MKPMIKFYLIGLSVAFLEEFITQGLLKRTLVGWIIPAIIAFVPFLFVLRLVDKALRARMSRHRATLAYYLTAGGIGLMVEWFIIGLSPWSNPSANPPLVLALQLGMFSFWGTVALAPRLLLDETISLASLRKQYKRFLVLGYFVIYSATLLASRDLQFFAGVASVLAVFTLMNLFYFRYIRLSTAPSL